MKDEVVKILNEDGTVGLFKYVVAWLEDLSKLNMAIGATMDNEQKIQMKEVYDSFFASVINVSKQTVALNEDFEQALGYSEMCRNYIGQFADIKKEDIMYPQHSLENYQQADENGINLVTSTPDIVPEGVVSEGVVPENTASVETIVPVMENATAISSNNAVKDIVISGENDAIPLIYGNDANTPNMEKPSTNYVSRTSPDLDRGIIVTPNQLSKISGGEADFEASQQPEKIPEEADSKLGEDPENIVELAKQLYEAGEHEQAEELLANVKVMTKAA